MTQPYAKDYWACGCVKRDRKTKLMTHIKLNHPSVKRCKVCKATKPNGIE